MLLLSVCAYFSPGLTLAVKDYADVLFEAGFLLVDRQPCPKGTQSGPLPRKMSPSLWTSCLEWLSFTYAKPSSDLSDYSYVILKTPVLV